MAIVYGEYGPYDTDTGRAFSIDPESGSATVSDPMLGGAYLVPRVMPDSAYTVRGDYRMPKRSFGAAGSSGALEFKGPSGWSVVDATNAPSGYDYRQDSNTQGSNERLRFDQAFGSAPSDIPITGMQDWAMANGWQEPNRSNNEGTLGALFSTVAPYAALMAGGIGAMGGFAGGLGAAGAGAGSAEGFGGAGMLGDSTMWGLGDAGTSGALGGSAMDFSNLGDLWDYGSEAGGSSLSDLSTAADQFGWSDIASPGTSTGANADIGGSSWFNTLIEQAKANPLGTAAKAVKSVLGGTGSNTSMLSNLAKLYSAYNSEGNLKNAIGRSQGNLDRAVNWQDPNQPRGNEANRLWTENYTNPKAGYNEFMAGAGRDFTDQARAAAAKAGKRGSYLNSGKMQSDLASLWMKNQFSRGDSLAKGFTNPRNYAADALRDSLGLSDLYKQKGGSIGMAVGDLLGSSQARELISSITGSYW